MGPATASAFPPIRPLTCMSAPHPLELRPDTPIDQAQGREPGRMFALLQPDRRRLTWYSGEGRKGPCP